MKRSKLETYYHDRFGADDAMSVAEVPPGPVRSARSEPVRRRESRRGFGFVSLLKLTLMLGPMAFLLGTTLLTDCQGFARDSWMPELLRSGACARRELAGRVISLDASLRSLVGGVR